MVFRAVLILALVSLQCASSQSYQGYLYRGLTNRDNSNSFGSSSPFWRSSSSNSVNSQKKVSLFDTKTQLFGSRHSIGKRSLPIISTKSQGSQGEFFIDMRNQVNKLVKIAGNKNNADVFVTPPVISEEQKKNILDLLTRTNKDMRERE